MVSKRPRKPLTPRQEEIILLKAEGLTSEEVATKLGISTQTVRTHCTTILNRMGAHNMTEAVAMWLTSHGR